MKLYISDGAVFLLVCVYTPLALLALWMLWRSLPKRLPIKIAGLVIASVVAVLIPLWDVMVTSLQMTKLCSQSGTTIKRIVNADGFYTNLGGSDHLTRGFKYIEAARPGNRIDIYTKSGNDIQRQEIDAEKTQYVLRSRYEFIFGVESGAFEGRRDIGIRKSVARDRETGEELGYAVSYSAYPGWVDRNTISLFGRFAWTCPEDQDQHVKFMSQVILPKK